MSSCLLLSGGMDSTALAFWTRPEFAITIDYGQRPAQAEINAASEICRQLEIQHLIVRSDLSELGSGDLAGTPPIPGAPETEWWPFRNQMLVTLAAMRVINLEVREILIGCLSTDGFHSDGTRAFINSMSELLQLQEGGVSLVAPAIELTADELILKSEIPRNLLAWAHSCHKANEACGSCRGCRKHYATLNKLGYEPY